MNFNSVLTKRVADDFNCKWKTDFVLVELLHARNGHEHAECAIEFSRIPHGVEMGAEQEDFPVRLRGWIMPDEIANAIHAHGHARLAHPGTDEFVRAVHRR